jgi:hypothetical protein
MIPSLMSFEYMFEKKDMWQDYEDKMKSVEELKDEFWKIFTVDK